VTGLLYGGNANQMVAQIKGSATITLCTLAAGLLLMYTIKAIGMLRLTEEGELEGLDIHEHGAPAYHPEPGYQGYSPIPPSLEGVVPSGPPSDIHIPVKESEH
jgi:Amt family ammonium transporter